MSRKINTVTGPVDVDDLGVTLMHEHFWFTYAGYEGQTLYEKDDRFLVEHSLKVAEKCKAAGVKTIVEPTGLDCGRKPILLKEVGERAEINIIMATGYSYEAEGGAAYFRWKNFIGQGPDELYELYMHDLTKGYKNTGIKSGFIKVGTSLNEITPYEESNMKVAARCSKELGIPICSHTERGTMGPEAAKLFIESGADPGKVVIYHMDGNRDIRYHRNVLNQGVYANFDRWGLSDWLGTPLDDERLAVFVGLLAAGYEDQLMMAQDTVNIWLGKDPEWPAHLQEGMKEWHITHVFEDIVPRMKKAGVTDAQINKIFVENPKRLFS